MEEFDANKDCVTGLGISVDTVVKSARWQPFSGKVKQFVGWTEVAANAVFKDLSWRNGIAPVIKSLDSETRHALVKRAAEIIWSAKEAYEVPFLTEVDRLGRDLDAAELRKAEAQKRVRELESEVSRLTTELSEQTQRRIDLEYALADAKAVSVPCALDSAPTISISEVIPPDGRVGGREGPVTVTTTGGDAVKTMTMHQQAVAVYGLESVTVPADSHVPDRGKAFVDDLVARTRRAIARDWQPYQVLVGDESFVLGVLPEELERLKSALDAMQSEAA